MVFYFVGAICLAFYSIQSRKNGLAEVLLVIEQAYRKSISSSKPQELQSVSVAEDLFGAVYSEERRFSFYSAHTLRVPQRGLMDLGPFRNAAHRNSFLP